MFKIFKKRKKVCPISDINENLKEHIETVEHCLEIGLKAVECYLKNDIDKAKKYAKKADKIESEADCIRRRFTGCLVEGPLLPFLRKDFLQLINSIDEIANGTENMCDFCLAQRPFVPDFLNEGILNILNLTKESFEILMKSLELLVEGKVSYGVDSHQLNNFTLLTVKKETKIDGIEWQLTREIFKSSMPLSQKIHIKDFLTRICNLSNSIEDVVERIEIIAAREAL